MFNEDQPGCLTIVGGSAVEHVLAVLDAVSDEPRASETADAQVEAPGATAVPPASIGTVDGLVVVWEPSGFMGSLDHILRPLSRRGAAVSLYWNVDGLVSLQGVSKGRGGWYVEVSDAKIDEVPTRLRKTWRTVKSQVPDDDPLAMGLGMILALHTLTNEQVDPRSGAPYQLRVSAFEVQSAVCMLELEEEDPELDDEFRTAPLALARKVIALADDFAAQVAPEIASLAVHACGHTGLIELVSRLNAESTAANSVLLYRLERDLTIAISAASDALDDDDETPREVLRQRHRVAASAMWAARALIYAHTTGGTQAAAGALVCGGYSSKRSPIYFDACDAMFERVGREQ